MIDLSKISSRINYCTILTTGRTGSDYLQACLDGVPGVLSFGGKFLFYTDFCEEIGSFENHNPNKILDLFISKNPSLFGSDYIENKNLKIDIDKLKKNYSKIVDQKSINILLPSLKTFCAAAVAKLLRRIVGSTWEGWANWRMGRTLRRA